MFYKMMLLRREGIMTQTQDSLKQANGNKNGNGEINFCLFDVQRITSVFLDSKKSQEEVFQQSALSLWSIAYDGKAFRRWWGRHMVKSP